MSAIDVRIEQLVVVGVDVRHAERLGPEVEAALARRLAGGGEGARQGELAELIAAGVHEAIEAAR